MIIDDKIRNEKLHYDINREEAKISGLSSSKIDKYEFLTGEEILPSGQSRIIEQATVTYSPLGKAFEKQTKTIEEQVRRQTEATEEHGKQLVKSNALLKKEEQSIPLDKEKEVFYKLVNIHNNLYIILRVPLKT